VHVTPFTARDNGPPRALVVVIDPNDDPAPPADLLRRLFGLTTAEADVAELVAGGHGLKPIADELALSIATVKTHLQRVFAKTDTHRQAELVRLLLAVRP
jgi:DNA-binding CsgD family transcriptional regulator